MVCSINHDSKGANHKYRRHLYYTYIAHTRQCSRFRVVSEPFAKERPRIPMINLSKSSKIASAGEEIELTVNARWAKIDARYAHC